MSDAPELEVRRLAAVADDASLRGELRKAHHAAERQEELFHELIDRCPFGIYIVDADFKIASMNQRTQDGAFINVRPVIGRPFEEAMRILWPEDVAQEIIGHFRRTLDTGEPFYSSDFVRQRNDVDAEEGYEWELQRTRLPDGRFGVICYYFDATELRAAQRQIANDQKRLQLLVDELNHRVKNTLAIIQSIARQSLKEPAVPRPTQAAFEGRLEALAQVHNVLTSSHWEAAELLDVLMSAARACGVEGRVNFVGPSVRLPPRTAVTMAMAVYELCTNAIKYGALSTEHGVVGVSWAVEGPSRRLTWRWQETGGPPVQPPTRRGFGSRMLEQALSGEVGGEVALSYEKQGFVCTLKATLGSARQP
jgi:two-component sensor histidine kinase